MIHEQRRIPPPNLVYSDYPLDDASSVSQSEPLICQPQHRSLYEYQPRPHERMPKYFKTTTSRALVDGHLASTKPRRQIHRSAQLQITMNRIQQRKKNEEAARLDWQRREKPEKVEQILEMVSAYDAVLDHLIRKNQKLKACARRESNQFPADQTMTSSAIVDTLELLRHEREMALGPAQPGRLRESVPRSSHNTQVQQSGEDMSDMAPIPGHLYASDHFAPSKVSARNERITWSNSRFPARAMQNNLTFDGARVEFGPLNDHSDRDYFYSQRNRQGVDDRYGNNNYHRAPGCVHRHEDERDDGPHHSEEYYGHPHHLGYSFDEQEYAYNYRQGRDEGYTQRNSKILSQLLPEKIPPKIKESRDRLSRFRQSRARAAIEYEMRQQPQSPPRHRPATSPPTYRYRRTSNLRLGSPERPYDLCEIDRYNRPIGTSQEPQRADLRHAAPRPSPVRPRISTLPTEFQNQPSDSSSVSPTEQARQLVGQVEDIYRFSKEVTESNEQMQHDLQRIQEISHGRGKVNGFLRRAEVQPLGRARAPVRRQDGLASRPYSEPVSSPTNLSPDTSGLPSPGLRPGLNPLNEPEHVTQPEQVQFKVKRGPNGELHYVTGAKPYRSKEKLTASNVGQPKVEPSKQGPPRQIAIVKIKKEVKSPISGFDFPDLLNVCSDDTCHDPPRAEDRYDPLSERHRSTTVMNDRTGDARPSRHHPHHAHRTSLLSPASSESGNNQTGHFHEPKGPEERETLEVVKAKEALYSGPIITEQTKPPRGDCGCVL